MGETIETNTMKQTSLGRWTTALLAFLFVLIPAVEAAAIDKAQLVQMSKIGIGDKELITLIDASGKDELKVTKEEIGELRLQGVSDAVIEHLKKSGRVVDGAAPADAPADTPPADTPPGDTPPADIAPPGDVSLEPAPADEGEDKGPMTEEELDAEMKRRMEAKKEEEERQRRLDGMARRLPEAKQLVDSGDNMPAARLYLEFLALNPDPVSEEWYEAKFGLAKALYQEGILSGASTPLFEVVTAGAEKKHFKEAFGMLQDLTKKIGYRPPALEELTTLYLGDLNAEFQDEFNYYMGKFFFDYEKSDLAIEYLDKVSQGAPDYPEALYVKGIAKLDPAVNDTAGALNDFQSAILAGEAEPGGNEEILQLGYLALARTFYEVGFYDVALFYYQKLPNNSARNAEATFEQAWTYFLKNDYARSLGTFHTLHSPYYSKWYFPDLYILEATVYLNLCMFEQSKVALAEFQKTYLDKQPRLGEFLAETTEPRSLWNSMMTTFEKEEGETKLPRIFANAVLDDLEFFNTYQVIQRLQAEQAALQNNMGALGEFGETVLARVNTQLDTKIEEGGILVQQKLGGIDRELTDWDIKATQISFDIDAEDKAQLEQRLTNPDWQPPTAEGGTTFLVVADDWQRWDFEGEYWLDEVSNYRSGLRSQCLEQ